MAPRKKKDKDSEGDPEFIASMEKLDELGDLIEDDPADDVDDYDFDGHDVVLDSIPSWIDEDKTDINKEDADGTPVNIPDLPTSSEVLVVQEQRDAYLEALRQLQADFENYKKRVIRDQQEYTDSKSIKMLEELLPVIDNFQLALKMITGKDSESKKLRKGIELVYSDLYNVLERQGLEQVDAEGALFDPEFHDAVSHVDNNEHEQEIVVEVLRPGYKVRGRVVRPAMVKVAK
ncbi:MAG TPA: nucleotide exchange factor GrpE [Acidimicrobiia bacterium]|nr:nucleotide exchange factor GrpE [Acidimicrobiia bacterium]